MMPPVAKTDMFKAGIFNGMDINMSGVETLVSKPEGNHDNVDLELKLVQGGCIS
jgi:hypothetical protein